MKQESLLSLASIHPYQPSRENSSLNKLDIVVLGDCIKDRGSVLLDAAFVLKNATAMGDSWSCLSCIGAEEAPVST